MRRLQLLVSVLVLVAVISGSLLTACNLPEGALTDTPADTATAPAASETTPQSVTRAASPATTAPATQEPTAVPTEPLPPTVVARTPARGEELAVDAPIAITFDQAMDEQSVIAAFSIEPAVAGKLTLKAGRLEFAPDKPLDRGATYEIMLADTAKSAVGLPLNRPVSFRVQTTGYLEVATVQPADGAQEVSSDVMIMAVFNRPVVPLVSIEDQKNLPQPLTIQPPVEGEGAWINTSIYAFRPSEPLASATIYRVTVKAGLTDTTNGLLAADYVWSFSTASPKVLDASPQGSGISPDLWMYVRFSVPMDMDSVESLFKLTRSETNAPVKGTFEWASDAASVTFKPASPLDFGAGYTATLLAGAKAAAGTGRLVEDLTWDFTVIGYPRVIGSDPRDGEKSAGVYGGVEVWFSGAIDEKTIWPNLTILPNPTNVYTYFSEYDARMWLSFDREPQSYYTVTIGADVADMWGNQLGRDHVIRFRTGDLEPMLYMNTPGSIGTYNTYDRTRLSLSYRNISSLEWSLYRLSMVDFVMFSGDDSWRYSRSYSPSKADLIRQGEILPDMARNELGTHMLDLGERPGKSLPAGMYYLTVDAPEVREKNRSYRPPYHILVVSPYQMILKAGTDEGLVWLTDLSTGEPVNGISVRLFDEHMRDLSSGRTDREGLFRASYDARDSWKILYAVAGSETAEEFGIITNRWNDGIGTWDFNLPFEDYRSAYVGLVYTDRPMYRPGQTVHFKGVVRLDNDAHYSLISGVSDVDVSIYDGEGNRVLRESLPLNEMGTFSGDMELDDEAGLGYYHLEASVPALGDQETRVFYADFQVAEYRKPEYEVSVSTDLAEYVQGDTINVTVEASYFFGGPVRNADIAWSLLSRDWWFDYAGEDWYDFNDLDWWERWSYFDEYGSVIASGEGVTDDSGRFTFAAPADIGEHKLSQYFTFDVSVSDVNNQMVAARSSAIVHKGEFYVGLRPEKYVATAGEDAVTRIITVDADSQPAPNVELQVVAYSATWDSVQEESEDGLLYWTSKLLETPVFTSTVTTDADGLGTFSFVPAEGGHYRVRAMGHDARENEVRSSTDIWVSGAKNQYVSWRRENSNRIQLVADMKEYEPGDMAEILIPSPYQGEVQALVTVERGHLYDVQLVTLKSNSEIVRVPIVEAHIPNVFVSVVIVKGMDETEPLGSFKVGYIKLPVSSAAKKLTVEITADQETYQPRQKATYTIRATDWMGRPAQAEFSLSLADLAALSLGGPSQGEMTDTFWHERGVGFSTSGSLTISVERLTAALEKERLGAKGGGGGADMMESFVRSEFPDTAYWNPAVMTNERGEASVTITLPDNLTTWRMDARGLTADTRVGRQTADVISTIPLMVRPVLPRFLVIGDEAEIAGIVHNNTDADIQADVSLVVDGLVTEDALRRTVNIPAHDLVKLTWNVIVQRVEQASVQYRATGDGLSDAIEITLPVYRPSVPETVATAGQLDVTGERVESIVLPELLDPEMGELTITVDPSLAAGTREGLKYLEHYPYECIEQTVSRFLPNVMTYRAMKELGVEDDELAARLPQMLGAAFQKIYSKQKFNGGWGWWITDEVSDYLTAYTLYGLTEAHKSGFLVDEEVMAKATRYLRGNLYSIKETSSTWQVNREVFKLFVLANYDAVFAEDASAQMSRAVLLYEKRGKMGVWARALLAMTLNLTDPEETSRIKTLMAEINSEAVISATGAHWEESYQDYRNMNTDTRSTAMVLSAIARFDNENPLGAQAVRWLMSVRREGRWESTYETVWSLLGLTDWMVATGELDADYSYAIRLNGEALRQGVVDADNVGEQIKLQAEVADLFLDRANALTFERSAGPDQTGDGRLYYTAHLNYYLPIANLKPLDRGIIVSREYRLVDDPEEAITGAKVGDVIQVRLTIIAPNDLHYLVLEDPLPAGCEAIDTSLATTSITMDDPTLARTDPAKGPWWKWWWYGWWSPTHTELRDEKVALFATYLARGTYQYTYLMRASLPGQYHVIPTMAYEMYFPEVFGRSAGEMFDVAAE